MRRQHRRIVFLLVALACLQLGDGFWIHAKAQVAQYLIANAWQRTVQSHNPEKPWPWADTWPVARLQATDHNVDLYILEGAQGSSLAFGPGHLQGSAYPGTEGFSVVGGHRDTHFRFLRRLQDGDALMVTARDGQTTSYRVVRRHIADSTQEPLLLSAGQSQLLLITCYPFDTLRVGGPLRYIVTAVVDAPDKSGDRHG